MIASNEPLTRSGKLTRAEITRQKREARRAAVREAMSAKFSKLPKRQGKR